MSRILDNIAIRIQTRLDSTMLSDTAKTRLKERQQNIDMLKILEKLGEITVIGVEGWGHKGKKDGRTSQDDIVAVKISDTEYNLKLSSAMECFLRGIHRVPISQRCQIETTKRISNEGVLIHSTEVSLHGQPVVGANLTNIFGDQYAELPPQPPRKIDDIIAAAVQEFHSFGQDLFQPNVLHTNASKLEGIKSAQQLKAVRSNDTSWYVNPDGQILMSDSTGPKTNRQIYEYMYNHNQEGQLDFDRLLFLEHVGFETYLNETIHAPWYVKYDDKKWYFDTSNKSQGKSFTAYLDNKNKEYIQYDHENGTFKKFEINNGNHEEIEHLNKNSSGKDFSPEKDLIIVSAADVQKIFTFTMVNACLETPFLQKINGYPPLPKDLCEKFKDIHRNHGITVQRLRQAITSYNKNNEPLDEKETVIGFFQRMRDMAFISDHLGLCCPSCEDDDENLSPITVTITPHIINKSSLSTQQQFSKESSTLSRVASELTELNKDVLNQVGFMGAISDIQKDIQDWKEKMNAYSIEEDYKIAMMIQYVQTFYDKIDAYFPKKSDMKVIKERVIALIRGLCEKLLKQCKELNRSKYRYAYLRLLMNAEEILIFNDQDELSENFKTFKKNVSSEGLNDQDEDEKNVLEKSKVNYNDPKQASYNTTSPIHMTLRCGPENLSILGGKLGVGKTQLLDNLDDEMEKKPDGLMLIEGKLFHVISNIEKESSSFDLSSKPVEGVLLTIQSNKAKEFRETTKTHVITATEINKREAEQKQRGRDSHKSKSAEKGKVVGCACCSGRSITALQLSERDRNLDGKLTAGSILDSIGYADFKGMLALPHERVLGRTFLTSAIVQVNLKDPMWHEIFEFIESKLPEGKNLTECQDLRHEICNLLEEEYEGTFYNVLISQLKFATHVSMNNFGQDETLSEDKFKQIYWIVNGHENFSYETISVIDRQEVTNSQIKKAVISGEAKNGAGFEYHSIDHTKVEAEIDTDTSELDVKFKQEDLIFNNGVTDEEKIAFLSKLVESGKRHEIDRGKGYIKIKGKWFKFQISNGKLFNIINVDESGKEIGDRFYKLESFLSLYGYS